MQNLRTPGGAEAIASGLYEANNRPYRLDLGVLDVSLEPSPDALDRPKL